MKNTINSSPEEYLPGTIPRDWQRSAIQKWIEKYKGVVSIVTGGGKTLFALFCVLEVIRRRPEKSFIIIVPTLTLLDQWYVSLTEDFRAATDEIGVFSSQEKSKSFKKFNIILLNTARVTLPNLKQKENYCLIVDECHKAGSLINSNAILGNYFATLGLSATPKREYDDGFERYIKPNLGGIIYEYTYNSALKDSVISLFKLINIEVIFLKAEREKYLKINKRIRFLVNQNSQGATVNSSLKTCLIQRAKISSSAVMRVPVTVKIVEQFKNHRVLIFHERTDAANEIYELLKRRGLTATIYHSGISPVVRRNNLQMYKRGIYNILITCKALDEGMNVPETSVAIISSSAASARQRIQRLGRALRPSKNKDFALIYTLYITEQEKNRLVAEYNKFEDQVEVLWLKSSTNGQNIDK